ncbi:MAG: MarR family transcriptional regulator [Actinobacteria bacterium]|nr:MarR family transcriptional regulator [Actinomycetota bacterium]
MPADPVVQIVDQWARQRPDLDASPILVVGRIARVDAKLEAALRPPFEAEGLANGDFDVLAALRRAGEASALRPAELSRALLVTTGAITKRLHRLEQRDLVRRDSDGVDDGRGKLVRLTPAGRRLVDRLLPTHLANEDRLLAALNPDERARLAELLARLDASLTG